MIPLSLILWLMMQGQQRDTIPDGFTVTPQPIGSVITCYGRTDIGCAHPNAAPTEHVIEIRTRRREVTKVCPIDSHRNCGTLPKQKYCPPQANCIDVIHVTREVWIDGSRVGVLKGLE